MRLVSKLVPVLALLVLALTLSIVYAEPPGWYTVSCTDVHGDLSQFHVYHIYYGIFDVPQSPGPCYVVQFYGKYEHTCRWYIVSQYLPPDKPIGYVKILDKNGKILDRAHITPYSNYTDVSRR